MAVYKDWTTKKKMPKTRMRVYVAICDHIRETGRFPTYRQIMERTSYKTTSAVSFHVNRLITMGLINFEEVGWSSSRKFSVANEIRVPPPIYWECKHFLEGTRFEKENANANQQSGNSRGS